MHNAKLRDKVILTTGLMRQVCSNITNPHRKAAFRVLETQQAPSHRVGRFDLWHGLPTSLNSCSPSSSVALLIQIHTREVFFVTTKKKESQIIISSFNTSRENKF